MTDKRGKGGFENNEYPRCWLTESYLMIFTMQSQEAKSIAVWYWINANRELVKPSVSKREW